MVYLDMCVNYGDGALLLSGNELPKAFIPISHLIQPMLCSCRQCVMLPYAAHPDFSTFVGEELTDTSSPALAGNDFVPNADYS